MSLGAFKTKRGSWEFRVWAPKCTRLQLKLLASNQLIDMTHEENGYYFCEVPAGKDPLLYFFHLPTGEDFPDPVSRFQPSGVHGPSQTIDLEYSWTDSSFRTPSLKNSILYELHIGTFTQAGTFDGAIEKIPHLKSLGINVVELMPVHQFPGDRNWGYDGVSPFAVQSSYGGPSALKRFVNACHSAGIAVVLDVVYNHLGPEGNYLGAFGHYFTENYRTPWGPALNFDGPNSDHVRRYFIENALQWIRDFHIDGLRFDAVHAICDRSAVHILEEICRECRGTAERMNKKVILIAESDLNDPKVVSTPERGGWGFDSQWNDDFHHALHVTLTGEDKGYYADFKPISDLAKAYKKSFVFDGQYAPSRKRKHGRPCATTSPTCFLSYSQNHDQVGNRMLGERLSFLTSYARTRLAAVAVLLSPFVPMLFMGEEYGETNPFLYFVHHGDPALIEAVRRGRKEEFKDFAWQSEAPDPQSEETFYRSKLNWSLTTNSPHSALMKFYQELIVLRHRFIEDGLMENRDVTLKEETILLHYFNPQSDLYVVLNFSNSGLFETNIENAKIVLATTDQRFGENHFTEPVSYGNGILRIPSSAGAVLIRSK